MICTRNDARLGVTNGMRGEVASIDGSSLTLTTGERQVVVDGKRYQHLDHGYALTAHKAQGITVDTALVVGSVAESRELAYSVMSRARGETRYFAIKPPDTDLGGRLSQEDQLPLGRGLGRSWSMTEAKEATLDFVLPR